MSNNVITHNNGFIFNSICVVIISYIFNDVDTNIKYFVEIIMVNTATSNFKEHEMKQLMVLKW